MEVVATFVWTAVERYEDLSLLTTSGLLQTTSASLFLRVTYHLPLAASPSCTSSLQEHLQAMPPHQTLSLSLQGRAPGNVLFDSTVTERQHSADSVCLHSHAQLQMSGWLSA